MTLNDNNVVTTSSFQDKQMMIRFRRSLPPKIIIPPRVSRFKNLTLCSEGKVFLEGRCLKANVGCWMFYLPKIQTKIFHAQKGMIDCTVTPELDNVSDVNQPVGQYLAQDWFNALQTPIYRRLAELWIISVRLWKAGIGPQPLGICFVEQFNHGDIERGPTCGLLTQNVQKLPRKLDCRLEQIIHAGVVPDQILSCVRQQYRGYVIDLCSVKGCQPVDAEPEVKRLTQLLQPHTRDAEMITELAKTLQS